MKLQNLYQKCVVCVEKDLTAGMDTAHIHDLYTTQVMDNDSSKLETTTLSESGQSLDVVTDAELAESVAELAHEEIEEMHYSTKYLEKRKTQLDDGKTFCFTFIRSHLFILLIMMVIWALYQRNDTCSH